jgi:cytochrome c oxidase subunit 2
MAVPASKVLIDLEDTTKAEMSIKITGHQWKWQYDYPKEGISFISNFKKILNETPPPLQVKWSVRKN